MSHWWCPTCQATKSCVQVKFDQSCTLCGQPVEWVEDDESVQKPEWSNQVPASEGWYWIKYRGKNGEVKCPCAIIYFQDGQFLIQTARNDSFFSHTPKDWAHARFGPQIEIPPD